jgi:hypothetical protein
MLHPSYSAHFAENNTKHESVNCKWVKRQILMLSYKITFVFMNERMSVRRIIFLERPSLSLAHVMKELQNNLQFIEPLRLTHLLRTNTNELFCNFYNNFCSCVGEENSLHAHKEKVFFSSLGAKKNIINSFSHIQNINAKGSHF